jgi:hypothetical protein
MGSVGRIDSPGQKLSNIFLLVTGGDQEAGAYIPIVCSLINGNQIDIMN